MSSPATIKKAKKLVDDGCISKIEDDLFQIRSSSDPNKSYFVTLILVNALDSKITINSIMEMGKKLIVLIWRQLEFLKKRILINSLFL